MESLEFIYSEKKYIKKFSQNQFYKLILILYKLQVLGVLGKSIWEFTSITFLCSFAFASSMFLILKVQYFSFLFTFFSTQKEYCSSEVRYAWLHKATAFITFCSCSHHSIVYLKTVYLKPN